MNATGVILAAGRGSRINPLSAHVPKPLLPICNKPIMQYQIEAMRAAGLADIVIVVGERHGAIQRRFGAGETLGVRVRYVVDEQPQGIASSLALVEPLVGDILAVFLGDIFLELDDIAPALTQMHDEDLSSMVLVKHEPEPDAIRRNFAVLLDEQGWVVRVIEKPKDLQNDLKGCGVYLFNRGIFDAIRHTPRSALRNEYELTDAIQTLIDERRRVRSLDAVHWDINVTFPVDLLNANLFYLQQQGLGMLIGRDTHIAPGTTISKTVIGDDVEISQPVAIAESVLFPGVCLAPQAEPMARCLVLPHTRLQLS